MQNINNLVNLSFTHITTNTIILIVISIIAIRILIKVISYITKTIAFIAVCWFILMAVQSTNIVNIPLVKQAYTKIEKTIPSKELWSKASSYVKDVSKMNKITHNKQN